MMTMIDTITKQELQELFLKNLMDTASVTPSDASDKQIYNALSSVVVSYLKKKRRAFMNDVHSKGRKQVYYLSRAELLDEPSGASANFRKFLRHQPLRPPSHKFLALRIIFSTIICSSNSIYFFMG